MNIDFILDIGCLWSFLDWRHLQTAMRDFSDSFKITPFFVPPHPFFPGLSINPADRARLLRNRIEPFLIESGINVCFDDLPDLPDDLSKPCRLIHCAFAGQKGDGVLNDVFDAFFIFGQNICDTNVLTRIAEKNGLPDIFTNQALPTVFPRLIDKEPPMAVPCLIFDHKTMIFGAQSVTCLKNMISLVLSLRKEKEFQ